MNGEDRFEQPRDRVIDGVDLTPFLRGEAVGPPHESLFWRASHYQVVRAGDWKLQTSARPDVRRLYNLSDDPSERDEFVYWPN